MLQNFLKITLRTIWKRKTFSFLNILGLAVGIGASLLIFLVIKKELSYENFHANRNRIYRIVTNEISKSNGEILNDYASIPTPLPDAMRLDFPQFEKVASVWEFGTAQVYVPGKGIEEERRFKEESGMFWVDPEVFDMFSYKWVSGSPRGLKDPNTVVLNESLASKFFDNPESAMGKTVQLWSYRVPLTVVGVFKDQPDNTDLPVRFGGSVMTLRNLIGESYGSKESWSNNGGNQTCFVLARKGLNAGSLDGQLAKFVQKYYPTDRPHTWQLGLQPLTKMHLDSRYETYSIGSLSKRELWSLALIGVFLLFVACINFINLSTAQSVNRSKEIGVRKVLGGNRGQLMRQFLQETALLTFISILLGCLLAWLALPYLSKLTNRPLAFSLDDSIWIIAYLLIVGFMVTLLAGVYPSMVLSRFKPMVVFRNRIHTKLSGGISLRRGLVVFQFVIAQLLIIGTVVVVKQMSYFRSKSMGFDKDGISLINLPSDSSLRVKYPMLKSRMEEIPGVVSASLCMDAPSGFWAYNTSFIFDNEVKERDFTVAAQFADTSYFRTFGLSLVAGRIPFQSDTIREFVVNETLVKKLGFKSSQEIIGKRMLMGTNARYPIVGVIKDYNNKSLHEGVGPVVMTTYEGTYNWIAVRMERKNMNATLGKVRSMFTGIYPTYLYDQFFFDERIERFYHNESVMAQLLKAFAFLAIFISCLGLYGLVSFMAVQKTKEVGIRKVLGASVQSIVYMFSREFTVLIGIAFLLSAPIGYYFMDKWLSGFHYHTSLGWGIFALAIVLSLLIAWITVGYKAVRAALANPVKSLKTE